VWKAEWWDEMEAFHRIVLIPDTDPPGSQLVEQLRETCPEHLRERVYVLQLPEGVKDANELWQQVDADPERFKEALKLATWQPLKELPSCQVANLPETDDLSLLAPLGELLACDTEQPLEYVPLLGVDGIIARGTLTLLGAHPKAGKTTLLIHACREWLQQNLRVVYLSEDSRLLWRERVKRFPELGALLLNTLPRAHPERWVAAIRALEPAPDIVIVDTLRRFLPAQDENDAASVAAALEPFVDLQQWLPRTAIILVHHTKKSLSSEGEITDIAGSHAFTAEVDAILLLAPVKEHKRQRVLTTIAGRLWTFSPEPLVLELSEDASEYRVVGTAEEVLPETRAQSTREKVLQAIRVLGQATRNEIEEYLRESGEKIPERTIRDALQRLYEDGQVERERVGARGGAFVYRATEVGNLATWQSLNDLPSCQLPETAQTEPPTLPECIPYDPRSETDAEWLARAEQVLDQFYPSFHDRVELAWDAIDDWLQQASMPNDPLGLEPHELEALRVLLAYAEAQGFPSLTLPEYGYTIQAGRDGWLNALPDIAGRPAVATATRMLQQLDTAGEPVVPATPYTNGDAGLTPSQLLLMEG